MSDVAASTIPETFKIPAERLGILEDGVEKLNRRARKLGFEPVVLVTSEPRAEIRTKVSYYPRREVKVTVWVRDVYFTGEAPRINGYEFQAALTHTPEGNLVSRAPGVETDLSGWRSTGARCQHCGLSRNRAETFVLKAPTGELVQIGRQCLVDYIGTTDVANAVQLWRAYRDLTGKLTDEDGEYGFGGGWVCPTTPLEFVTAAVASVKRRGFVKTQCADEQMSTRDHASWILGPEPKPDRDGDTSARDEWRACQPTEKHETQAKEILEWVLTSNDSSDYMHNARVGCGARTMIARSAGLLASLPSAHDKHLGVIHERKVRPAAGPHVGVIGQRIDAKVVVKFEMMIPADPERQFSVDKALIIMADANNSTLKTFASGQLKRIDDLKEGEWYLRGTVSAHDYDKKRTDEPVTVLKRCDMSRTPFPALKVSKPRKVHPSKGSAILRHEIWSTAGIYMVLDDGEQVSDKVATGWKPPAGIEWSMEEYVRGVQLQTQFLARMWDAHRERNQRKASGGFEF